MSGLRIACPERVAIGEGVGMHRGVLLLAQLDGPITIGDQTLIGPYCVLRSADHRFEDPERPIAEQGYAAAPIVIGRGCWLGSSVVVTKGVTIGNGVVVGAHSVVTRDLPAFSVAMGVPARVIRMREGSVR